MRIVSCRDRKGILPAAAAAQLLKFFRWERIGMFRGDICRAAVLAREGGFYVDLDVEPAMSFSDLISNQTTFVSAASVYRDDGMQLLNAIMGARPGSQVVLETLHQILKYYRSEGEPGDVNSMGPITLREGVCSVAHRQCPGFQAGKSRFLKFLDGELHVREGSTPMKRRMAGMRPADPAETSQVHDAA